MPDARRSSRLVFRLQTVPPRLQGLEGEPNGAARAGGFSLHAGVDIAPNQREKLERLCRYVSRPPVASERLAPASPPPDTDYLFDHSFEHEAWNRSGAIRINLLFDIWHPDLSFVERKALAFCFLRLREEVYGTSS